MGWNWPWNNSSNIAYERDKGGDHWNFIGEGNAQWGKTQRLELAKSNPIAAILIDFIAEKLGQVEWKIEGKENYDNDPLIQLLNNPNYYQSKQDYLKQFYWYLLSHGFNYVLPLGSVGFNKSADSVSALYNLKGDCVEYHTDFRTPFVSTSQEIKQLEETKFKYNHGNKVHTFMVGEIIPFYDLGNGLDNDFLLKSPSRLDAIKKPLVNIELGYDAENIAIQSNGKELFIGETSGDYAIGIKDDEKREILSKTNNNYGLGAGRSRAIVSNVIKDWKSLHIALKDLAIQESIASNGTIVANALKVPSEIYEFLVNGSNKTFTNQEQARVAFIHQVVQPLADNIANSFISWFGYQNTPLRASFAHLPEMQIIEEMKADKVLKLSQAIRNLVQSGYTVESANQYLEDNGIEPLQL